MSGHSKWSTIKRQKGAQDAKRGQTFTKLSKAIIIAVKEGGGISDPNGNFRLRLAIDRARGANMPKDTIERAIAKAKGADSENLSDALYEGFAPGGAAVIIQAVTDNKARTVSELKNIFEKIGGTLGSTGSVSYMFSLKGEIIIDKRGKTIDEIFTQAVEEDIEDIEEEDGKVVLYTKPDKLNAARIHLSDKGFIIESSEIIYKPTSLVKIDDERTQNKIINLLDKIEESEDVQKVFTNADFVKTY